MCNADEIILRNQFLYCEKTENVLDIPDNCIELLPLQKIKCSIFRNQLQILSKYEDEYNRFSSETGDFVIYSSQGELYSTNCTNVDGIVIPKSVDTCTKDLPVFFEIKSLQQIGYLTKTGLLRRDTKQIPCTDDYDFFQLNNTELVKQNKFIGFVQKYKKYLSFMHTDIEVGKNISQFDNQLLAFYNLNFDSNTLYKFVRDILLILTVIIIIFFTSKNKWKDIKLFLQKILQSKLLNSQKNLQDNIKLEVKAELTDKIEYQSQNTDTNVISNSIKHTDTNEILNSIQNTDTELEKIRNMKKVNSNINLIVDSISENKNISTRKYPTRGKKAKSIKD